MRHHAVVGFGDLPRGSESGRSSALRSALMVLVLMIPSCSSGKADGNSDDIPIAEARAELLGYVWDVTAADGYRYGVTDNRGHVMDTAKIIQAAETGEFVAVYHWWSDATRMFYVSLATSADLLDWTWRVDLGEFASQPTIAAASDGGYVVAWERHEPPEQIESHVRLNLYATWEDLLAGRAAKVFDAEWQLSECAEGTPNLYAASSVEVDFGFHYYAGCDLDRQARGRTDWITWEAVEQPLLDRAVLFQGYMGSVGDRDVITFRGHEFTFLEGQFGRDDWSSFRVLLYDEATGAQDRVSYPDPPAEPPSEHVFIRTHSGSFSLGNLTITTVQFDGRQALVICLFIHETGSRGDEAGQLIYYRFIDESEA